jgi:hypothetical protein
MADESTTVGALLAAVDVFVAERSHNYELRIRNYELRSTHMPDS